MSKTFRAWDVDQVWLLPPSVHDFVPAGHPAHLVRELVRTELDLAAILDPYERQERGQPPYHPAMMVALLLYAYTGGIYASRRIARACEERLDIMAVTGMQRPDFRTVSDFRKRHLAALGELFVQVLRLCREAGLVKLGHVALDGTKLAAHASKHKAMSYGRMARAEATLAAEVQGWLAKAEAADVAEDAEHGPDQRGDELPDWVADKKARLERIRAAKGALEAEAKADPPTPDAEPGPSSGMVDHGRPARAPDGGPPERAQRNFTDPDSRVLKTRDGFVQGYNGQLAVDAKHQIIVAQRLTTTAATRPASPRCSMPPGPRSAASRARSRPMPASAARSISPRSPRAASGAISPPAAPPTAAPTRAAAAGSSPARGWPRWRPSSSAPAGARATACASRRSSR
jgi:transposase